MYQNSQLTELLAPHQNLSNNTDIAKKYGYSRASEGHPEGFVTTILIQLMPHGGIISYPTTTSTELEGRKYLIQCLKRKRYIHKTPMKSH